jgi:hypothetical protein
MNNEAIMGSWQELPTTGKEDVILFHYQFKCESEWQMKCATRKSPGCKSFIKNYPNRYAILYADKYIRRIDNRMVDLWIG